MSDTRERVSGLSGNALKVIAIILMIIDHFGSVFCTPGTELYAVTRLIGRLSFPIFAFLIVEGFLHTRNVWKYILSLLIFAVISEVLFDLMASGTVFNIHYQNVLFTFAVSVLMLKIISYTETKKICNKMHIFVVTFAYALAFMTVTVCMYKSFPAKGIEKDNFIILGAGILGIIFMIIHLYRVGYEITVKRGYVLLTVSVTVLISIYLNFDYSWAGVLAILLMYKLRGDTMLAYFIACTFLFLMNRSEVTSYLGYIFINMYNGTRGKGNKYLFYLSYPLHILILLIIFYLVK